MTYMYLHVGGDVIVNTKNIIGIFDMDNTTVSRIGRGFLPKAQKDEIITNATEDLPKSYVVTAKDGKSAVYISSVSSQVLSKRAKSANVINTD